MTLIIQCLGFAMIALALMHVIFPRYFEWAEELPRLSLINRQMMQVHAAFIALTVFLMGLLAVTSSEMLLGDPSANVCPRRSHFFGFAAC
ncbi:MAG: hypothetical protein AAFU77_06280 [Myxococcota bacterium]